MKSAGIGDGNPGNISPDSLDIDMGWPCSLGGWFMYKMRPGIFSTMSRLVSSSSFYRARLLLSSLFPELWLYILWKVCRGMSISWETRSLGHLFAYNIAVEPPTIQKCVYLTGAHGTGGRCGWVLSFGSPLCCQSSLLRLALPPSSSRGFSRHCRAPTSDARNAWLGPSYSNVLFNKLFRIGRSEWLVFLVLWS